MESIILGGFLYLLDTELSYDHRGLVFFFNGLSINYILLLIIGPVILYLYILEHKKYKSTITYSYNVQIVFNNGKLLNCNGFIDTGNKLRDPVTKKYVILISRKLLEPYINIRSPMYVPYKALNKTGLIECFSIKYLKINEQIYNNYLVGVADNNFHINGTPCLLNSHILEEICCEK